MLAEISVVILIYLELQIQVYISGNNLSFIAPDKGLF